MQHAIRVELALDALPEPHDVAGRLQARGSLCHYQIARNRRALDALTSERIRSRARPSSTASRVAVRALGGRRGRAGLR